MNSTSAMWYSERSISGPGEPVIYPALTMPATCRVLEPVDNTAYTVRR